MLKGLKKKTVHSQPQQKPKTERQQQFWDRQIVNPQNSVGVSSAQHMDKKTKENSEHLAKQLQKLNQQAFSLLLDGQMLDLKAKLEYIRKKQTQYFSHGKFQVPSLSHEGNQMRQKGKFEYQLQFGEDEEQQGRRKKYVPKIKAERKSDFCQYCPENQQLFLLSASNYVYLAFPKLKTFKKFVHLIIAPVEHQQTRIGLDSDIEQEIKNYQKCLIQMFEKMNLHAIFIEQYSSSNSHIYIECLGIPLKRAYDLPFFFKQGLENVEGSWTSHKNIIEIRKQKGGILKQIPKQIKYCYIDFGLGYGYAHVIENEKFWDRGFLYEVIASALGLESYHVKTTQQYNVEELELKAKEFDKMWKKFDWTSLLQQ